MARPITKAAFVDAFATSAKMSKADASAALDALTETATQLMQSGQTVALPNLLTLEPKEQAARKARNPATGEMIDVPAKTVAKAKISAPLKAALNEE